MFTASPYKNPGSACAMSSLVIPLFPLNASRTLACALDITAGCWTSSIMIHFSMLAEVSLSVANRSAEHMRVGRLTNMSKAMVSLVIGMDVAPCFWRLSRTPMNPLCAASAPRSMASNFSRMISLMMRHISSQYTTAYATSCRASA
jgi:hypothetical protein